MKYLFLFVLTVLSLTLPARADIIVDPPLEPPVPPEPPLLPFLLVGAVVLVTAALLAFFYGKRRKNP